MTPNASKCVAVRELLNDRLDHRLEASRAPEVDAHLRACRSCASYDRGLRALRRSLRTAPRVTAPPGRVSSGVMRRIDRRRSMMRGRASLWVSGLAAAALVLVVAAVRDSGTSNAPMPVGSRADDAASEAFVQTPRPLDDGTTHDSVSDPDPGSEEERTVADATGLEPTESAGARSAFEDPVDEEAAEAVVGESTSSAGATVLPSGVAEIVFRATQVANAVDTTKGEFPAREAAESGSKEGREGNER